MLSGEEILVTTGNEVHTCVSEVNILKSSTLLLQRMPKEEFDGHCD